MDRLLNLGVAFGPGYTFQVLSSLRFIAGFTLLSLTQSAMIELVIGFKISAKDKNTSIISVDSGKSLLHQQVISLVE
jgi:hypothetical protein